ncbi:hypothetical protein VN97_g2289 [Penicillium thymicola]|uniref:Uncharacterized protein n=1 Tax=Penicillium thymicola TaxID=293382 RepID=A0AAI9TPU9_PENTH|nr:hypothetical protein VN97_g2289 [Penicillium thymicola]
MDVLVTSPHFSSLALLLSLLTTMSRPGDFDHLCGSEVWLEQPSPSPSATFVLDDKLSEEYQTMTQEEFDEDVGHKFVALKFSCHNPFDPAQ